MKIHFVLELKVIIIKTFPHLDFNPKFFLKRVFWRVLQITNFSTSFSKEIFSSSHHFLLLCSGRTESKIVFAEFKRENFNPSFLQDKRKKLFPTNPLEVFLRFFTSLDSKSDLQERIKMKKPIKN